MVHMPDVNMQENTLQFSIEHTLKNITSGLSRNRYSHSVANNVIKVPDVLKVRDKKDVYICIVVLSNLCIFIFSKSYRTM